MSALLRATVLSLALCGCRDPYPFPRFTGAGDPTPRRGGTLRFAYDTDVNTTDPALANDVVAGIPTRLVHAGLVDYGPGSTALVPSLAERWEISSDGTVYTFHLRPSARFSTGRPVTSEDFRYSWERLISPETASPGAENYRLIVGFDDFVAGRSRRLSGVEALDPRTLRVRLTQPDRTFLHVLAMRFASVVPREEVSRLGDERFSMASVGAGPFAIERWEPNVRIVLRRNPHFWDAPRPWLDRVVFELSVARHLQFMRFLAGEIELGHNYTLSTADYLWLRRNRAWAPFITYSARATTGGLMMNTEMAPFDNVHLRRAVAFAVDRESLCRARNYRIRPAAGLYPPSLAGARDPVPNGQRYDVSAALREMRLAGYTGEVPGEVELWLGDGESGLTYGQLLQADLRRIGLRVRIRQVSNSVYYTSLQRPRTVRLAFDGWAMDFPDPSNFIEPNFHSRGIQPDHSSNHAFYRNPELDRLIDRARVERDSDARIRMYQQGEQILLRDAPWVFMYHPLDTHVVQPYVKNWVPHPVWNEYVGDLWLDLPLRRFTNERAERTRSLGPFGALAMEGVAR